MKPAVLQTFIEETQVRLPEICEGITAYWQNPQALEKLRKSLEHTAFINRNAALADLHEISEITGTAAAVLKNIVDSQKIITPEENSFLLEQLSNLDFLLSVSKENINEICLGDEDLENGFFGEPEFSKSVLTAATESPVSKKIPPQDFIECSSEKEMKSDSEDFRQADEFEIDEEMLEIFALEAEDHLRNISANLAILEGKNDNLDALLEIRRSAHTLKGSAGIVGFVNISKLAHRVEDLLDYISENGITGNARIFELLMLSTDCLESLANGQNSPELDDKIAEIYIRFDEIMTLLQSSTLPAPEKLETIIESPSEKIGFSASVASESTVPESVETVEEITPTSESLPSANGNERRSVIRVSLERLDDLVKLASEMIVTRSTFESRLAEFEQQIQELLHSTNRLRRSTGKLEIDFEASTLENKTSAFHPFGSATFSETLQLGENDSEFDALEFDRYTEFHQTVRELAETAGDVSAIRNNFDNLFENFSALFDTQRRLVEEMQESLMRLRMVPLNSVASRIYRAVRVAANEEGKLAELHLENADIEIDTQILDTFVEPLLHLLRNAVAHGIEQPEIRRQYGKPEKGKITLKAYNEGTHIVFVIADDGHGIEVSALKKKAVSTGFITVQEAAAINDEEAFSLIFLPGLSTAKQVNQISGRGVGMNVVKAHIARRQGTISVKSVPHKGTSFIIRLPMSLAVTRALLVKTNEQTFAFPLKIVKQVIELAHTEIQQINREKIFVFNGTKHKFFNFSDLINFPPRQSSSVAKTSVLILENSEMPCAIAIDRILRTEEIVIKPLGSLLQNVQELIGATIMGDGSVIPVLDLIYLVNQQQKPHPSKQTAANFEKSPNAASPSATVLIVDDSPSVRHLNSNLIKNAGWTAVTAKDGLDALEILQTTRELPCIILTDVEMPRMDGYEFLAAVKKQDSLKEIPVVMITSRSGDKHRQKAYEMGVSEYINKPFEESALIQTIKNLTNQDLIERAL